MPRLGGPAPKPAKPAKAVKPKAAAKPAAKRAAPVAQAETNATGEGRAGPSEGAEIESAREAGDGILDSISTQRDADEIGTGPAAGLQPPTSATDKGKHKADDKIPTNSLLKISNPDANTEPTDPAQLFPSSAPLPFDRAPMPFSPSGLPPELASRILDHKLFDYTVPYGHQDSATLHTLVLDMNRRGTQVLADQEHYIRFLIAARNVMDRIARSLREARNGDLGDYVDELVLGPGTSPTFYEDLEAIRNVFTGTEGRPNDITEDGFRLWEDENDLGVDMRVALGVLDEIARGDPEDDEEDEDDPADPNFVA